MSAIGNMNSVHAEGLKQAIEESVVVGHVLFVWGSFGLGKTEIVRQVLEGQGYTVIDWYRGSQATPDTFAGVPYLVNGELHRAKPELLRAIDQVRQRGGRPAVFLDELNLSSPAMLAAMLQFLLDRRLGEYEVGQDVPIVAAGNMADDGSLVSDLPLPAANRMTHVHYLGPTADEWLAWAMKGGVHHAVQSFIDKAPQWLVGYNEVKDGLDEMGRVPTPRTWKFVSDILHYYDAHGIDDVGRRLAAVAARVGDVAASQMEATLQTARFVIPIQTILTDPQKAPLPDTTNPAIPFMQLRYLMNQLTQATPEQAQQMASPIVAFISRMGREYVPQFISMALDVAVAHVLSSLAKAGALENVVGQDAQAFNELRDFMRKYGNV